MRRELGLGNLGGQVHLQLSQIFPNTPNPWRQLKLDDLRRLGLECGATNGFLQVRTTYSRPSLPAVMATGGMYDRRPFWVIVGQGRSPRECLRRLFQILGLVHLQDLAKVARATGRRRAFRLAGWTT